MQGDIIKRKFYKIILFSFILFLSIGIVAASENATDNSEIKELIDECEDKGTV